MPDTADAPPAHPWLIRISGVFSEMTEDILARLGVASSTALGSGYHLVKTADPGAIRHSDASPFVKWSIPVSHSWPCNPQKTEGFIEKAAQALFRKFGGLEPQAVLVGQLDPSAANPYYKTLSSNLRGRTLQLFPAAAKTGAEEQDPDLPTLFCLVGREGLFCGLCSPKEANGFFPGGTRFISQSAPGTISRAGAKIAEALHHLRLHRMPPPAGAHWLELGASPGGMTSELLKRGYRVTAVDRAPLDPRLDRAEGLVFLRADAATFEPEPAARYDAILSDMNGGARESIRHVLRLAERLQPGGLVVFTLKMPDAGTVEEAIALAAEITALADPALKLIARTHLTYNRHEFTFFFER